MTKTFPPLTREFVLERLEPPNGPVSLVLDTDTYNEIDDQFAVVYALLSPSLDVRAIYAAPFHNKRSSGPGDGMIKSYEEILRLLEKLGRPHEGFVFKGSDRYLPGRPVESEAARDLIARAKAMKDKPLYVVAIGAITNVASALLMAPEIIEKIVIVWLGGHPQGWPNNDEFNLRQDVRAAQVVFGCGVPLVQIPCANIAEQLRTTLPEMAAYVKGKGAIGDYLYQIYEAYLPLHYARSKVIWDISTIGYLVNPGWFTSEVRPAPVLRDDRTWEVGSPSRHPFRVVTHVDRDGIFGDLFRKLEALASPLSAG